LARDNGLSPTVTIPTVTRPIVSGLLDAGALGFCLCHAETLEQVEALVRWMKYPPDGERALAHAANAGYRIDDAQRYCAEANRATLLLLKIESRRGIANAEALLSNEWVDGVVFGPGDLAADMGLHGRGQDAAVLDAIDGVIALALKRRVAVEAAVTATDKAEYQRQRARGIQIFGPARATEYDHLRRGAELAIAPFR
jgi:2-keto-3-deoxy-L-rhamnonate aldolase RhmA